jgi:uncharacterized membrane protein
LNFLNYSIKVPVNQPNGAAAMVNAYGILKFIHVLSVIIWIGGIAGLSFIVWRLTSARNRAALSALLPMIAGYGQKVVAPAAGLVLLSGLAMVGIGRIGFGTFWVLWGFGGVVVHAFFGALVLGRRAVALTKLASDTGADDATVLAAGKSLWSAQLVYLLLFATVVAAMVLKPTL